MKKILMFVVATICFAFVSNAQSASCKVQNPTEENATVVGYIVEVDNAGYAHLTFSSDESSKRVNVTFQVSYGNSSFVGTKVESGSVGVNPNQTATARLYIGEGSKPKSLTISGARCN
jgi:hypothetical protein